MTDADSYTTTSPITGRSAPVYLPVCDQAGNIRLIAPAASFVHKGVRLTLRQHPTDWLDDSVDDHWVAYFLRNPGASLDPADIVWPWAGYPVDADGRGLSWLETKDLTTTTEQAA